MNKSKQLLRFKWLMVCISLTTAVAMQAQDLKIVPQSSNLTIFGTSNLHAWEIKVAQLNGELGMNSAKQINLLVLRIPVKTLKSGNGIMDGKTYDAFDAKKNPTITFQLTEVAPVKISDKDIEVTLTGNLTLAGFTKKISFKSTGKANNAGQYLLNGSVPLKMTDFNMKPPTAIFGTLKTGDAVTIKFNVTVEGAI